jgi:NAD(P)-dependent dehydrogenase (short-subunit alcohol dehydrogenase family)/acyl carrier protein
LAAIQIARHLGAKIVATAGTAEKRAFLRNYGADLVCDSRSLAFVHELRDYTAGKGVDVALNSASGEAMVRTLDCLCPFGRFVELGKRDFFANTHIPLRPMRQNLTYFGVDVDQLMSRHADLAQRLFGEVIELFQQGELVALPHRIFEGRQVQEAFRLMQRSGHIGKVVVRPVTGASQASPESGWLVDGAGTHVVIGGTRGFGLATAEWLASRGASRLILASLSGQPAADDAAKIVQLQNQGVDVAIEALDVADQTAVRTALQRWRRANPIKGIVHAAMVLDDRLIERIDDEAMERVLRPKALGALNLESAIDGLDLDYLILYSSATTYFGNPGQYNYVAANGYVEGVARRLRSRGIPAHAVAWGAIEDAGYLARNMATDAALKRRFTGNLITAEAAFGGLNAACDAGLAGAGSYAVARIDWAMAKRELAAVRRPLFSSVARDGGTRHSAEAAALLERLKGRPLEEITEALTDIVVEEIARVLRLPLKEVDRHRPLAEIGMDSLMMLELRTTVESSLQIEVPMLSLSSGITPAEVARRVAPLVTGQTQQNVPSAIVALSTSHIMTQAGATDTALQSSAIEAVTTKLREMDGSR